MKLMRLKPGFPVVLGPKFGVEKLEVLIRVHGDLGCRPPDSDVLSLVSFVPMNGENTTVGSIQICKVGDRDFLLVSKNSAHKLPGISVIEDNIIVQYLLVVFQEKNKGN